MLFKLLSFSKTKSRIREKKNMRRRGYLGYYYYYYYFYLNKDKIKENKVLI